MHPCYSALCKGQDHWCETIAVRMTTHPVNVHAFAPRLTRLPAYLGGCVLANPFRQRCYGMFTWYAHVLAVNYALHE